MGCSSSVTGNVWIEKYLESLDAEVRQEAIVTMASDLVFEFGNSKKLYRLPVIMGETKTTIEIDYVS